MCLVLRKSPKGDPDFFLWSDEPAAGPRGEQDMSVQCSVPDHVGRY